MADQPPAPDDDASLDDLLEEGASEPTASEMSPETEATSDGEAAAEIEIAPPPVSGAPLRPQRPGPGLLEAFLWCFAVLLIHMIAVSVVVAVCIATGHLEPNSTEEQIRKQLGIGLLVGEQAFFLVAVLLCTRLRIGAPLVRRLSFLKLRPMHLVLLAFSVIPLQLLSGEVSRLAGMGWDELTKHMPRLQEMDSLNVMEQIDDLVRDQPVMLLLFALAIAPALGEELIFRGIIGRGLLARYGIFWGVFWTSVFFAAVHVHPVHAAGVFGLGVFMHYVYLVTRSFWAPMLFHFLNNGWALTATLAALQVKEDAKPEGLQELEEKGVPWWVHLGALLAMVMITQLLWRTRATFRLPNGQTCTPGYPTLEQPPHPEAERVYEKAPAWLSLATVLSLLLFWGLFFNFLASLAE